MYVINMYAFIWTFVGGKSYLNRLYTCIYWYIRLDLGWIAQIGWFTWSLMGYPG